MSKSDKTEVDAPTSQGTGKAGEIITADGDIELNAGRKTITLNVKNSGDRAVQIGSHYHFFEANKALDFDRNQTLGFRLDIPAGTVSANDAL